MASDLASTPSTGVCLQCCGDAHLCNFGVFATPERRVIFAINDLDKTLPAPWEWDVKCLGASFVVACRDNGLSDAFDRAIAAFSVAYADQNEKDHAALARAVRKGKVKAVFEEAR